jgi:hypothetical protein
VDCAGCACVWTFRRRVSSELGDSGEGAGIGAESAESKCEIVSIKGVADDLQSSRKQIGHFIVWKQYPWLQSAMTSVAGLLPALVVLYGQRDLGWLINTEH